MASNSASANPYRTVCWSPPPPAAHEVSHTRARAQAHMHTHTHMCMQTRHCSPFPCHALHVQMAVGTTTVLEFPRCLTGCTVGKLTESCMAMCGPGYCCCASAGNSCIPCDQTCPCPTCSTELEPQAGACPNDPDGEWALFDFVWTSVGQTGGTKKKKCCRLV